MPKSIYRSEYHLLLRLLRGERMAAGLSQRQLGAKLGKPQSYINKYETGERRLDAIELLDLSHAIGFKASKLITRLERLIEKGKLAKKPKKH